MSDTALPLLHLSFTTLLAPPAVFRLNQMKLLIFGALVLTVFDL